MTSTPALYRVFFYTGDYPQRNGYRLLGIFRRYEDIRGVLKLPLLYSLSMFSYTR